MHRHFLLLEETLLLNKDFRKLFREDTKVSFLLYKINKQNSNRFYSMANMDETPKYLNMPTSPTVKQLDQRKFILEHKDK